MRISVTCTFFEVQFKIHGGFVTQSAVEPLGVREWFDGIEDHTAGLLTRLRLLIATISRPPWTKATASCLNSLSYRRPVLLAFMGPFFSPKVPTAKSKKGQCSKKVRWRSRLRHDVFGLQTKSENCALFSPRDAV